MQPMLSSMLAVGLLTAVASAQCSTLSYFGAFNGQKGTMFEIQNVSTTAMVIGSFDQAFYTTGSADMEIYTIAGPCAGLETTPSAWTLVGTAAGVAHTGATTNPAPTTPIPIPINITIAPGATQSFYITATAASGSSVYYTSGVGQYGVAYSSNADLALIGRTGMSYPFGSAFGIGTAGRLWNGIVNYCPAGSGTVFANRVSVGTGCVSQSDSFYERFPSTPSIDLSNSAFRLLFTGTSYIALPSSAAFIAPSASATNLGLTDESNANVVLSSAFNYPGGSTNTLNVNSNGHVAANAANGVGDWTPTPGEFLNFANASWAVWRDLIPGNAGGTVTFEEVGGVAVISFNNVIGYVGTSAGVTPSTFQFQFDLATGNVDFVFGSLDLVSISTYAGGEGWLVGFSPAGPSIDAGNLDLSVAIPNSIVLPANNVQPLAVGTSARPIGGTLVNFQTSNLAASTAFGAILLGFTNPSFDLGPLGMAGCTQYSDGAVTLLFLPFGQSTASTPFGVPNFPGIHLQAQAFAYDPASGLTALGAIASNGLDLTIGDF